MDNLLTPQYIMFGIGLIGVVITVYNRVNKPQTTLETKQALDALATEKDRQIIDNRAGTLAQQVQWEKEATDKKFVEMATRIDAAFTIANNHINTIETEVKAQGTALAANTNALTRLSTIIDERIPKKS